MCGYGRDEADNLAALNRGYGDGKRFLSETSHREAKMKPSQEIYVAIISYVCE
jgi:hypothetical protein